MLKILYHVKNENTVFDIPKHDSHKLHLLVSNVYEREITKGIE